MVVILIVEMVLVSFYYFDLMLVLVLFCLNVLKCSFVLLN